MSQELKVDIVVKWGGSTLAHPELFDGVLSAVESAAYATRLLIVPGGGPFADDVRQTDRRHRLSDDAAHWMAVSAMDQTARLVGHRLDRGTVVTEPGEIEKALGAGRVPVLSPSAWLREADPLPHSWDVTSDSIAAWVAGRVGARRLVLIKPPGVGRTGVDPYFSAALPEGLVWAVVAADQADGLAGAIALSGPATALAARRNA